MRSIIQHMKKAEGVWIATGILWGAALFAIAGLFGLPRWYVNFRRKRRFKNVGERRGGLLAVGDEQ